MKNKIEFKNKNKKNIILLISIIAFVVILIFILIALYFNKLSVKENENINSIEQKNKSSFIKINDKEEYGMEISYDDLVNKLVNTKKLAKNTEIKVLINNKEFKKNTNYKFDKVGKYKIKVELTNEYTYKIITETKKVIKNTKEYTIEIEDTVYPEINGVSDKEITVGDTINILEGITANDKVDGDLEIKSEGTVDTSKAGVYTIKISATDKNGNKTEKEFKVTVKNKVVSNNGTSSSNKNNNSSSTSSGGTSSCSSSSLKKGGYNLSDKDACSKDSQARIVAQQIANEIKAKGYTKDIDKVTAAAERVSGYYYNGSHSETGIDYRTPYGVFIKGEASCAGCTRALILVLEYLGYTNVTHANENQWTHQWVILYMDGQIGFADGQVGMVGYGKHPVAE